MSVAATRLAPTLSALILASAPVESGLNAALRTTKPFVPVPRAQLGIHSITADPSTYVYFIIKNIEDHNNISTNVAFVDDLCKPNPCGSNADCKAGKDEGGNARAVCFCRAGYVGNPLVSCRQEPCIEHAVTYYPFTLL